MPPHVGRAAQGDGRLHVANADHLRPDRHRDTGVTPVPPGEPCQKTPRKSQRSQPERRQDDHGLTTAAIAQGGGNRVGDRVNQATHGSTFIARCAV